MFFVPKVRDLGKDYSEFCILFSIDKLKLKEERDNYKKLLFQGYCPINRTNDLEKNN